MNRTRCTMFALLVAAPCGQTPAPVTVDPMHADALRATLEFLAADERGGRDSPSAGLAAARDYLAARAERAGLAPGAGDGFLHRYTLPGVRLDRAALKLTVRGPGQEALELRPDRDVRIWRVEGAYARTDCEPLRVTFAQEGVDRLLQRRRGDRPVLIEVPADGALWQACSGPCEQVSGRSGPGGPPWLLVREGVLPAGELRADVSVPAPEPTDVALENVAAVLRSEGAREWVLFTAHYDHLGIGVPRLHNARYDAVYNGADDNASGSAAVLALAEAFAARRPALARNLAFVWFSAEEKGMRGSSAFVADPPLPLADIAAVVNLEMLGRPPGEGAGHAWITGDDLSDFAAIARPVLAQNGVQLVPFAMAGPLFSASDNLPFARKGVVAHSFSAGSLHSDYHQPGDETGYLHFEHMSRIVRGLYAFGIELATREGRPAYNAKGRKQLALD